MGKQERLLGYPWSGLGWYLAAPADRPAWMRVDRLLGEHGSSEDTAEARRVFERRTEARRAQEDDDPHWEPVRRGWCLGGEGFRQGLLERIEGKLGEHHAGQLRAESAAAKAERIIGEELQRVGWTRADLEKRKRIAPEKLKLAARLRRETTLTINRITALPSGCTWAVGRAPPPGCIA
ncbi:MAG: hypothetical protein H7A45_01565 [Verrucomicrobiales bacterium]|nr:hypothetical protein [Verrucomicrobiales bacterium]